MMKRIRYFVIHEVGSKVLDLIPTVFFRFMPLPRFLIIEATNACNLRCPLCPTNTTETRHKGMMSLKNFQVLVDDLSGALKRVAFNAFGEPTLNPRLFDMISYASSKGIYSLVSTNTTMLGRYINQIFDSKLNMVIVCLDGATKKTHESYRVGSNFSEIVNNIKKLVNEKKKRGSLLPKIQLQFVVMKQNEKEIPKIIKLAKGLGVDELSLKTVSMGRTASLEEKLKKAQMYLPRAEKYRRYTLKDNSFFIKNFTKLCNWAQKGVVLWNGNIGTCCYDFNGDYPVGNIFRAKSFRKIWFSEKYALLRKKIMLKKLSLCAGCNATSEYGIVIEL